MLLVFRGNKLFGLQTNLSVCSLLTLFYPGILSHDLFWFPLLVFHCLFSHRYTYQDPIMFLTNNWISLIISIYLHILKCLSVCLCFCMVFFHDKTAAPIGPKFWVEALQNMYKVLRCETLALTSVLWPPKAAISVYWDVRIRQCCRRPASKR